jgi:hypothetical protein
MSKRNMLKKKMRNHFHQRLYQLKLVYQRRKLKAPKQQAKLGGREEENQLSRKLRITQLQLLLCQLLMLILTMRVRATWEQGDEEVEEDQSQTPIQSTLLK